jgi:hypothetical protein
LVFFGSGFAFAQPFGPHTEDVGISARVGEEVTVTPGGGSSGSIAFPTTGVRFSGEAYPSALVTLLKTGAQVVTVNADGEGYFSITLPEDYSASVLYSLYAEDVTGERSLLINYPLVVQTGFVTHLSGIRFPPTIVTDKIEAKQGDFLTVSGAAMPDRNLEITLEGSDRKTFSLVSSALGSFRSALPLQGLSKGGYTVSVRYEGDARTSKLVKFSIGELNIFQPDSLQNIPGDCNSDMVINLVDFSILAFWYGKSNPPVCVDTNRDGKINLTDFSILAFYWTG